MSYPHKLLSVVLRSGEALNAGTQCVRGMCMMSAAVLFRTNNGDCSCSESRDDKQSSSDDLHASSYGKKLGLIFLLVSPSSGSVWRKILDYRRELNQKIRKFSKLMDFKTWLYTYWSKAGCWTEINCDQYDLNSLHESIVLCFNFASIIGSFSRKKHFKYATRCMCCNLWSA